MPTSFRFPSLNQQFNGQSVMRDPSPSPFPIPIPGPKIPPVPMPQSVPRSIPAGRMVRDVKPAEKPLQPSSFLQTVYGSMKNIDPEQRSGYLQDQATQIKGRLDRYEFRLARGIPLTAEQQQQYNSMKAAFNDIQNYINNPQVYETYFTEQEAATNRVANPWVWKPLGST